MAKNIKRTILSEKSPRNRHIAWAEPKGDSLQLNIFNEGKWRPIAGGSSDSSGCENVVIAYNTSRDGTWNLVQGNFENAMEELSQAIPINISIWDIGETIKPHLISKYFPAAPNRLPFTYKDLVIEGECIIIITDTMRTTDDIIVWTSNGIFPYDITGGRK